LKRLVPDEGIEPPTFGLQNRCSTAELIRPMRLHRGPWLPARALQRNRSVGRLLWRIFSIAGGGL